MSTQICVRQYARWDVYYFTSRRSSNDTSYKTGQQSVRPSALPERNVYLLKPTGRDTNEAAFRTNVLRLRCSIQLLVSWKAQALAPLVGVAEA